MATDSGKMLEHGIRLTETERRRPDEVGATTVSRKRASQGLVSVIHADNREVDRLLRSLGTAARAGRARGTLWERMARLLTIHCHAEEDALYRLMVRMPDSFDHADVSIEEHDDIQEQVAAIDRLDTGDPSFTSQLDKLHASVRDHVESAEHELLPLVVRLFDPDELVRLAARYARLKETHRTAIRKRGRTPPVLKTRYELCTPDALYAVAQAHRIPGRGGMNRGELIQAIHRFRA